MLRLRAGDPYVLEEMRDIVDRLLSRSTEKTIGEPGNSTRRAAGMRSAIQRAAPIGRWSFSPWSIGSAPDRGQHVTDVDVLHHLIDRPNGTRAGALPQVLDRQGCLLPRLLVTP